MYEEFHVSCIVLYCCSIFCEVWRHFVGGLNELVCTLRQDNNITDTDPSDKMKCISVWNLCTFKTFISQNKQYYLVNHSIGPKRHFLSTFLHLKFSSIMCSGFVDKVQYFNNVLYYHPKEFGRIKGQNSSNLTSHGTKYQHYVKELPHFGLWHMHLSRSLVTILFNMDSTIPVQVGM